MPELIERVVRTMYKLTDLFSEKVQGAREALPQVAVTLEASHRTRLVRIDDPSVRRFHRAIDDLLKYLGRTGTAFEVVEQLRPLRILLRRAASDFEIAAEAILAAHDGVTMMVMRDVMEVEYLVRDFAQDLARIPDWIASDESDRWRRFRPAKLREREAGRRTDG